ncbi:MAG: colicin V production CvpA [Bacteroidetes bacterium QH_6_64_77]|nr:MAG: colicin V production CvpA [Bacteroidetes bacterium QH_6_64_77]
MLTALDWFIVVVLLCGLIRGYMVGAVRQAASLLGLVAALLFSVEFMDVVGEAMVTSLGLSESLIPLAGFTVLFLAGGAVGGVKAALLLSLLFLVLSGLEMPEQDTRDNSTLYRPVARLLPQTIEATEEWVPAAKKAADQLSRRIRSEVQSPSDASPESVGLDSES